MENTRYYTYSFVLFPQTRNYRRACVIIFQKMIRENNKLM